MSIIKFETIENKLIKYNNDWVLLDKDVATLNEIEPKKLRQQLKRNIDKFPSDYAIQLTDQSLHVPTEKIMQYFNDNSTKAII